MVRQRVDAVLPQELGGLVDCLATERVDDSGVTRVLRLQEGEQLFAHLGLADNAVLNVGPVETRHEVFGVAQLQAGRDLLVRGIRRCGGESDARYVGPAIG